jgi:hypothetical protein
VESLQKLSVDATKLGYLKDQLEDATGHVTSIKK